MGDEVRLFFRLGRERRGATAIEYGLIAVAAITSMNSLGKKLSNTFNNVGNNMKVS